MTVIDPVGKANFVQSMSLFKSRIQLISILFAAVLLSLSAHAQGLGSWTLDQVLSKIEEANGGQAAIEKVRDVRVLGQLDTGEVKVDFILLKRRPDRIRISVHFVGMSEETAFNGTQAWKRVQARTGETVELLSEERLAEENLDSDFDGPLIGDLAEGFSRKLIGVERIDRVDYFKAEVIGRGLRNIHYIDSRTFRELKKEVFSLESGELLSTSYFSDYVNHRPIWVAYTVRQEFPDGRTRTISISSADFNVGILERTFDVPAESKW